VRPLFLNSFLSSASSSSLIWPLSVWGRNVQLRAGADDPARVRRNPKVMQVLEVHAPSVDQKKLRFSRRETNKNTTFMLSRVQLNLSLALWRQRAANNS
jgi:hypothetical protein